MKIFLTIFLVFLTSVSVFAQDDWVRVQSDNGEFSIEIPTKYNFIVDQDGFRVSDSSATSYPLKKMNLLNGYIDKTLVSFEIYEATSSALSAIYERELSAVEAQKKQKQLDFTKTKSKENNFRQLLVTHKDYQVIRHYFNSKNYIYILTSVSKNGENEITKRFFNSLLFDPNSKQTKPNGGKVLSTFKVSKVDIITANVAPYVPSKNKTPDDPNISSLVVAWRPSPSYIDNARMKAVQGRMQLRCTFAEDGFIPKIEFINILPEGLARQAIFAALRLKFLPKEIAGKPISSERIIEYNFSLY